MKKFLGFIVDETLEGRQERLKEYTIALEVFGRDETFDPTTNALVRVEAGRLRRTLKQYYLTSGRKDPIAIEIPRGGYVPTFAQISEEPSAPRAAETVKAPAVHKKGHEGLVAPLGFENGYAGTKRRAANKSKTPTVLVVDDEPDVEALISRRFRRAVRDGTISFLFAADGEQALEVLLSNHDIDLVLTDINMPRMDGLTLLDHLDQIDPLLTAIVVSAYGDMENIRTSMNRGAFDFVTKPINFEDLSITIDKALAHRWILDEAAQEHDELDALRQELGIAAHIQESFRPATLPESMPCRIAGRTKRAQGIGGDFFDYFPLDERRIAVAVAEVSGNALPAALAAVYARAALRTSALSGVGLQETVYRVNELLCVQAGTSMSVSLFLGFIDLESGTMDIVNAGQREPIVIAKDGSIDSPEVPFALALGRDPKADFETGQLTLRDGDTLVLYTGGMTKAFDRGGRQFSIERLEETLSENAGRPVDALVDDTLGAIERFMEGGDCQVDLTCLALKRGA